MANSRHLQIRDAIKQAMLDAGVAGSNVQRGRDWAMADQDQQLVKVYLDQSTRENFTEGGGAEGMDVDWTTRVRCECHARGTVGDNGEDLADALLVAAVDAVLADPTLGGLAVVDLQPMALAWSSAEAETSIGIAQCVFQVVHRTPSTTIAA